MRGTTETYDESIAGVPPELEEDWVEALTGAAPSPALSVWLEGHPAEADELASLQAMVSGLDASREAVHPGAHFFAGLEQDILNQLEDAPLPVALRGGVVAPVARASTSRGWLGWLDGVRELFARRPTLTAGFGMAAALLALVVYSFAGEAPSSPPAPLVAAAPAEVLPAGLAELKAEELAELRLLAAEIDIDLQGDEDEDDALDGDLLAGWGETGMLGMATLGDDR